MIPDRDRERRAIAVRILVERHELDAELALTYVVWPTPWIDEATALLPDPVRCRFPGTGIDGYQRGCRCETHRDHAREHRRKARAKGSA